ncbi:SDR family NAD(P)-dependent oxidoreductase [Frondihabitans cladoniiphilus]|uniref:SDR family oxidoreductase n=1 Tax=Frondihabitans cladoniiphilus TaxID=715785 RepID=A0ABP8VY72_9MICO
MTTALITGASTGIGAAFARRLAEDGLDLVLVARSADKLELLASEVRASTGVSVTVLPKDLGARDAPAELAAECERLGLDVDFLLNNAGFGTHGLVADADPAHLADEVRLNCATLTELTARFLPAMTARGRGTIVNVASNAAFQPLPQMAVYGATKAFVLSFTEALWHEAKGTGVRVLALCPGPTDTPFFEIAGEDFAGANKRTTDQLIATAKRALARNQPSVVDGLGNAALARLGTRLLPKRLLLLAAEKVVTPR